MIVAEIGLNHLGRVQILDEYINIPSNVDAITIQVISDNFYDHPNNKSLKISDKILIEFIDKIHNLGIKVGLAIDDYKKINKFLPSKISFYKILSKDIENKKLIDEVRKTNAESIYISTGTSDYNLLDTIIPPLIKSDKRIKLIHTTLSNDIAAVNLKAIETMRNRYKVPIAYGHHCSMLNAIYASLGFMPESVFFYIKGSQDLRYPDNAHAVELTNIEELVSDIKVIKKSIGNGVKISMKNWW